QRLSVVTRGRHGAPATYPHTAHLLEQSLTTCTCDTPYLHKTTRMGDFGHPERCTHGVLTTLRLRPRCTPADVNREPAAGAGDAPAAGPTNRSRLVYPQWGWLAHMAALAQRGWLARMAASHALAWAQSRALPAVAIQPLS